MRLKDFQEGFIKNHEILNEDSDKFDKTVKDTFEDFLEKLQT